MAHHTAIMQSNSLQLHTLRKRLLCSALGKQEPFSFPECQRWHPRCGSAVCSLITSAVVQIKVAVSGEDLNKKIIIVVNCISN